jgi:hypothetical protein
MQANQQNHWEELYAAAVVETDPEKISVRINLAKTHFETAGKTCKNFLCRPIASGKGLKMPFGL